MNPMMNPDALAECIRLCWTARTEVQEALFGMCLQEGGPHVSKEHVTLMTDCMQVCQTAADFMTRRSHHHLAVCEACAEVCEACADSCEDLQGMEECARACRECAESCHAMSQSAHVAFAS